MSNKSRSYRKLWLALAAVITLSFLTLGYYGFEIYRLAPPVPERVVTTDGTVLFTGQDIRDGQNVWQSMGGQEVGSIWGHGAYVAPESVDAEPVARPRTGEPFRHERLRRRVVRREEVAAESERDERRRRDARPVDSQPATHRPPPSARRD